MLPTDSINMQHNFDMSASSDSSSKRYMLPTSSLEPKTSETTETHVPPEAVVNHHPMVTRGKKGILKTKTSFAASVTTNCSTNSTPLNAVNALADPVWHEAMKAEFASLQRNKTWSLVPVTDNMNIVGSKWVFKVKYKVDGLVERHKTLFVLKVSLRLLAWIFLTLLAQL